MDDSNVADIVLNLGISFPVTVNAVGVLPGTNYALKA